MTAIHALSAHDAPARARSFVRQCSRPQKQGFSLVTARTRNVAISLREVRRHWTKDAPGLNLGQFRQGRALSVNSGSLAQAGKVFWKS
jgi:hypothetical protein